MRILLALILLCSTGYADPVPNAERVFIHTANTLLANRKWAEEYDKRQTNDYKRIGEEANAAYHELFYSNRTWKVTKWVASIQSITKTDCWQGENCATVTVYAVYGNVGFTLKHHANAVPDWLRRADAGDQIVFTGTMTWVSEGTGGTVNAVVE